MTNDTIFALSSGLGKSGVAVIRISGNNLSKLFCDIINKSNYKQRHAYYTNLLDTNGDLIDQCIAIYFIAPHSFTGEDVIEIHSHGSNAVVQKIFEHLHKYNARIANRGEFSQRAFYNNKMNLSDIDGLVALLDAKTDQQRKRALSSMLGADSKKYSAWREQMIEISAYASAIMDYSDDDLPKNIRQKIIDKTKILYLELNTALSNYDVSRALQQGFNITLVGETNVGKSSLFNRIIGSNRAIVSDIAGTTRDVINHQIDIDGFLVNLSDTAGLRNTDDLIEQIGIQRTKSEIEKADLILRLQTKTSINKLSSNEILIINKSDLLNTKDINNTDNVIYVSAKTGFGIDNLMNAIKQKLHNLMANTESMLVVNTRTYSLLYNTVNELNQALTYHQNDFDIFAEHIKRAADNIGKILGIITTDEVMNATFSRLCLGK